MATAIEVEHLTKTFVAKVAVDDISFAINQGEIVGFLGPNGAGKSTTLRMLTCFLPPTRGRGAVMGYDIFNQSIEVRRRIGYLPEATPLYPEMRVEEYLHFRARLKGVKRADAAAAVDRALDRTRTAEVRTRVIGQLSKGYKQRVGLADALVASPPILILDEPTIGLDPNQIRQTRGLIKELGEDHTVFLSTHILPEVEQICDRVIIIHKGRVVGQGTPSELRDRVTHGVRLRVEAKGASQQEIADDLSDIRGVKRVRALHTPETNDQDDEVHSFSVLASSDAAAREGVFFAAVDGDWILRELRGESLSLEDVFAYITSEESGNDDDDDDETDAESTSSKPATAPVDDDEGEDEETDEDEVEEDPSSASDDGADDNGEHEESDGDEVETDDRRG